MYTMYPSAESESLVSGKQINHARGHMITSLANLQSAAFFVFIVIKWRSKLPVSNGPVLDAFFHQKQLLSGRKMRALINPVSGQP